MESGRARLCLPAAHTKSDLDMVWKACDEVGDFLLLKISTGMGAGALIQIAYKKHGLEEFSRVAS
jgi:hypothetical protein